MAANVAVPGGDQRRIENLCRYVLRPPVAQNALERTADGKMLLHLHRPWRDGTRAIRFEPSELLEKLAAMIPRPWANLLLYHGAFASRGCWREHVAARLHEETAARAATCADSGERSDSVEGQAEVSGAAPTSAPLAPGCDPPAAEPGASAPLAPAARRQASATCVPVTKPGCLYTGYSQSTLWRAPTAAVVPLRLHHAARRELSVVRLRDGREQVGHESTGTRRRPFIGTIREPGRRAPPG